jgi:hypothetical protein
MITRRSLFSAVPALLCAPAIIRVAKLMPISPEPYPWDLDEDYVNQLRIVASHVERSMLKPGEWRTYDKSGLIAQGQRSPEELDAWLEEFRRDRRD